MEFIGAALPLAAGDIAATAAALRCEPAVVWAVCDVESDGHGFLADKRPQLLFEAHQFHILTKGRWDDAHPNISSPSWNRVLYGAGGAHQYDRLAEASALDRGAALASASWGLFQIMGSNFAACGFASVADYVTAMCDSEGRHLAAFAAFCRCNRLDRFLRARDWTGFALGYNGPGEADNGYDAKLAAAYRRRLAAAVPP